MTCRRAWSVDAAARGMGGCLAPEGLLVRARQAGRIVLPEPNRWLDVPLYWHHAAVRSSTFQHITDAIRATAARHVRQRA